MSALDRLIVTEKPAVKHLSLEAVCDPDISYPDLEKIIEELRNKMDGHATQCKIKTYGDSIHVIVWATAPQQKTMFDEYISG